MSSQGTALVSVVVSCYNVESYVDICLKSLCEQNYSTLEILVVDDGSTDGTRARCEVWSGRDSRIVLIEREHGGPSAARNSGMERARGDYILCVDGDDYVAPTHVERLVAAAEADGCDVVLCGYGWVDGVGKSLGERRFKSERNLSLEVFLQRVLTDEYAPSVWSKLFKRSLIENVRFREGVLYEDVLFCADMADQAAGWSGSVIDSCDYKYRRRSGSIMQAFQGEREYEMIKAWDAFAEVAARKFESCKELAATKRCVARFEFLDRSITMGNATSGALFDEAVSYLLAHKGDVLSSPWLSRCRKFAYRAMRMHPALYVLVRKFTG